MMYGNTHTMDNCFGVGHGDSAKDDIMTGVTFCTMGFKIRFRPARYRSWRWGAGCGIALVVVVVLGRCTSDLNIGGA